MESNALNVKVELRSSFTFTRGLLFKRVKFTCVLTEKLRDRGNQLQIKYRRCKSSTSLNFYVYARSFIHSLQFITARKIYMRSHGKITRQWKSTLIHHG